MRDIPCMENLNQKISPRQMPSPKKLQYDFCSGVKIWLLPQGQQLPAEKFMWAKIQLFALPSLPALARDTVLTRNLN